MSEEDFKADCLKMACEKTDGPYVIEFANELYNFIRSNKNEIIIAAEDIKYGQPVLIKDNRAYPAVIAMDLTNEHN